MNRARLRVASIAYETPGWFAVPEGYREVWHAVRYIGELTYYDVVVEGPFPEAVPDDAKVDMKLTAYPDSKTVTAQWVYKGQDVGSEIPIDWRI